MTYVLTIRDGVGTLMDRQPEATLAEARDAALRITTVHGQKSWTVDVDGPRQELTVPGHHVATYRKGREVRRGK